MYVLFKSIEQLRTHHTMFLTKNKVSYPVISKKMKTKCTKNHPCLHHTLCQEAKTLAMTRKDECSAIQFIAARERKGKERVGGREGSVEEQLAICSWGLVCVNQA